MDVSVIIEPRVEFEERARGRVSGRGERERDRGEGGETRRRSAPY